MHRKQDIDLYNQLAREHRYDELMEILPKFYIAQVDCQPNVHDLEPPIGRHEGQKLIWDCNRRTSYYTSIDMQLLIQDRGDIYEFKRMLVWDKSDTDL